MIKGGNSPGISSRKCKTRSAPGNVKTNIFNIDFYDINKGQFLTTNAGNNDYIVP